MDALVDSAAKDEALRTTFREILNTVFSTYEEAALQGRYTDDLAGAVAFYIGSAYAVSKGNSSLRLGGFRAAVAQIQSALNTGTMRAASSEEKQRLYEEFIALGGLLAVRMQLAGNAKSAVEEVRALGRQSLKSLLKLEPSRVRFADDGITILPDAGISGSALKTLLCDPARGWVRGQLSDGIRWTLTKEEYLSNPSTMMLVLMNAVPRAGGLHASFRKLWKYQVLTHLKGEENPFVMVGLLNGRSPYAFVGETMENRSTGERVMVTFLLVEGKDALYPAMILESLHFSDRKKHMGPLMATLRTPGNAAPRPLAAIHELARKWSTTASSVVSYVNAHTGNHAGTSIIAYRHSIQMKPDGTYSADFAGIGNGYTTRERERGRFRLKGDMLVLTQTNGRVTKKRFLGIDRPLGASGPIMLLLNPEYNLNAANIALYGEKYGVVAK